ncbi:RagB/SusD family nutrient uptake outer membrane protein [Parabacteroides sp. W1-Q-101]|uniref:RagB/SusD family nutrient uptake outer membrane protein n=1 Tax=Parabacteroides TaxID=375288 RepID=UPI0020306049|nr:MULTISPECIES: RagB/SusD family nutrient uptake outer membrane protein [Parabacteroides]MCM0719620.1 RagB/SusD family nutrient uptake outer membrane protein [Parabacteroides sp. W1-Q-101]
MKISIIQSFQIICLLVGTSFFVSCDDFLDRQEDEKLTFDKIWEARNNTRSYWLNSMSFLPNDADDFNYSPWLGASDEGSITYDRDTRWINFGSWNASSVPYYKMDFYYKGIRECNIFMQNVDRCSDPIVTKEELAQWKVQSRFARAYYYFMMMRIYGPVFLLGDELLDFTASTEDLYRPRNTWDECVNYVVSEMEACINDPAMAENYSDAEKGLATKGACQALIARLKLYSARDLFNGNKLYSSVINPVTDKFPELSGVHLFPQEYDANKWLEAAKAAKVLIDNSLYKLYRAGDGSDPYANYYGITQEHWNSELIWSTGYKGRYTMGVHTVPTGISGTAYGGVGPTQQQVDAYAMSNGRYPISGYSGTNPVIDTQSGYSEDEFEKTTWEYPAWGGAAAYDLNAPNMYKDREPRFYVSVFFGGNKWHHGSGMTLISFAKGGNGNKSHDYPKSGYLINRFYDHTLNSASGQWGNIVFPTFRLAEMYLNFIESVLECKKRNVALPSGYETQAMELWGDLRDRAGLASITDVYPNATTEELIELCRRERRIELAFENHRYFDTRTWMISKEVDGGPIYGMNTQFPGSGDETPDGFWERVAFETRVFEDNHYLYPFSQRELDRNKLLTQNYGW